ncbi:MAG: Transcriptional regulator of heat shock protein [Parcubacteria group bacterium GW2011_GWA2_51_12]|nr:MAG: Transcriptional regulator of heat shock protein [Parcubacteria group bacterium GW2011_GWA2_51_12]
MPDITQRQGRILAAIVKEYSQTGEPVGSEILVGKYRFDLSSATIRNEMKGLEKANFIQQPHTSAGRIPTDKGYRYFVNKLMQHLELTAGEQQRLRSEISKLKVQYMELGRSISKLLSEQGQGAAFALLPESTSTAGLSQVIQEDVRHAEVREVARFLDELERHRKILTNENTGKVAAYIGKEAPVPLASDFSLVLSRVKLPGGKEGVIGIVGPKRMKYARNMSLVEYVAKLVSGGLFILFLMPVS